MEYLLLGIIIGILIVKVSYAIRYYFFFKKSAKDDKKEGGT